MLDVFGPVIFTMSSCICCVIEHCLAMPFFPFSEGICLYPLHDIFYTHISQCFLFTQFLWRPRPPSFLSKEKEEEIAKNLKKYSKKYEAEDQDVSLQLSEQDREKRKKLKEEWEAWINEWKQLHEEEKMEREKLRDGEASDEEEEYEAKEVEVEEILNVIEEVIPFEESQQ